MRKSNREINFSSQRTAIPFGKFESGSDDIFPCNESMIGREGARAKLIDFLTNGGTRKAILITGRRGMGKTSFVNYCLDEYEEARIERYWRSDIGRNLNSWVWLLAISLLCAAAFVLGSGILKILLDNVINKQNHFLWIPLVPLVFCLCYPTLHAVRIFTVIFKNHLNRTPSYFGYCCVSLVILMVFLIPDSGTPIVTLSRLLVMLATIYYTGELLDNFLISLKKVVQLITIGIVISFMLLLQPIKHTCIKFIVEKHDDWGNLIGIAACFVLLIILMRLNYFRQFFKTYWEQHKNKRVGWLVFSILGAITGYLTFYFEPVDYQSTPSGHRNILFFSNLFIASELIGLATINRYIGLCRKPKHIKKLQISIVLKKSQLLFLVIGVVLCILPFFLTTLHIHFSHWFFTTGSMLENNRSSGGWWWLLSLCFVLSV